MDETKKQEQLGEREEWQEHREQEPVNPNTQFPDPAPPCAKCGRPEIGPPHYLCSDVRWGGECHYNERHHAYVPPQYDTSALVRKAVLGMAQKLCREQEREYYDACRGSLTQDDQWVLLQKSARFKTAADALNECLAIEEA